MPRQLPWKTPQQFVGKSASREPSSASRSAVSPQRPRASTSIDLKNVAHSSTLSVKRESSSAGGYRRSASTSPPPGPPEEIFMAEGPESGDQYRMVEDEFLSVAQRFTAHLHAAEYQRLKRLAKSENATTIQCISRPVVGGMTEDVRRKHHRIAGRARRDIATTRALGIAEDTDNGYDQNCKRLKPWENTSLNGLMESPRKQPRRLGKFSTVSASTRAAAGLGGSSSVTANGSPTRVRGSHFDHSKGLSAGRGMKEDSGDDLDGTSEHQLPNTFQTRAALISNSPSISIASRRAPRRDEQEVNPGVLEAPLSVEEDDGDRDGFFAPARRRYSRQKNRPPRKMPEKPDNDIIPGFL